MTAICAGYDIATGGICFHFVAVEELNGEPAIDVEGELRTIDEINDDAYGLEVVRLLGENDVPDTEIQTELSGILKRRFAFLK